MPPALDLVTCPGNGWILTPGFGVRAVALGAVVGLMAWTASQRAFPGRGAFAAMQGAIALWLLAGMLEHASADVDCKAALALLAWPAILGVPVTWALFVAQYRRSEPGAPARRWWWLHVAPLAVFTLLVASNGVHGLLYGAATRAGAAVAGTPQLHYDRGPLFWTAAAWAYALLVTTAWRLALAWWRQARAELRAQWSAMLAVSALPIVVNLAYAFLGTRLSGGDPTPLACAAAALVLAALIARQRVFALVPLARRLLFTELPDPVLVLDPEQRVIEANVAARQLCAAPPPLGAPLAAWPRFGEALARQLAADASQLSLAAPTATYELHVREIGDAARRVGTLVQLREVTAPPQTHGEVVQTLAPADGAPNEAAALQAFLREQAMRDPLTGLLNRRALDERYAQESSYAKSNGHVLALVLLDIDHFKRINDTHGHAAGDQVLRDFSAALRTGLRASDAVFRVGGEEFALLLPGADAPQAARRLQALRERLAGRKLAGLPEPVTFSAGVASTEDHGQTLEALMAHAEKAMHQAKSQGRNRTVVAAAEVSDDELP